MLTRFLDWVDSTKSPLVVGARRFLRRSKVLRATVRATIRWTWRSRAWFIGSFWRVRAWFIGSYWRTRSLPYSIGTAPTTMRRLFSPPVTRKLRAIAAARAVGGMLSVPDLERLHVAGRRRIHALCIGGAREVEQMREVLRRKGARSTTLCTAPEEVVRRLAQRKRIDLIVASPHESTAGIVERLQRERADGVLRLGELEAACSRGVTCAVQIRQKANSLPDRPLRIVLLNDVGFLYGAGVAMRRQAASFALNGWDVSLVTWSSGENVGEPSITGFGTLDGWRGIQALKNIHAGKGLDDDEISMAVASKIDSLTPDVVVVQNIHGAEWPIEILSRLRDRGLRVLVYMHDCYWVTGRCCYSGSCELFLTGCNATCPTADEYPRLAPERIAPAWKKRGELFAGAAAIPLIANSTWTRDFALRRFRDAARTEVVHIGLDHRLFSPIPKAAARALLDLPQDKTIVLMGAINVKEPRKGGEVFQMLHEKLTERSDAALVLFGKASEQFPSAKSFGLVDDERLMPFLYSAADIFVSTATEEAFGQTLLEASACAVPVLAFNVGGVKDIVVSGETGILVDRVSANDLLRAVESLISDPALRERLGGAGRRRVEGQFTLEHQAAAWAECLERLDVLTHRRGERKMQL